MVMKMERLQGRQVPKAYSEPCQTCKMECFAKIVKGLKQLPIFAKHSILDAWQGSEYPSG